MTSLVQKPIETTAPTAGVAERTGSEDKLWSLIGYPSWIIMRQAGYDSSTTLVCLCLLETPHVPLSCFGFHESLRHRELPGPRTFKGLSIEDDSHVGGGKAGRGEEIKEATQQDGIDAVWESDGIGRSEVVL